MARAVVCGPGRLVGAIGNHWGNEIIPNHTCTYVCKSVYSEHCAEDEEDAAARLASWGGGETVPCFVSDAGHVRLARGAGLDVDQPDRWISEIEIVMCIPVLLRVYIFTPRIGLANVTMYSKMAMQLLVHNLMLH